MAKSVVTFKERTKHGKLDFHPGVKYQFEDVDAVPYFKACGWVEDATGEADVIVSIKEIDIDPETVWGTGPNKGAKVVGG